MRLRDSNIIVCDCGAELNPTFITPNDFIKYSDGTAICSRCGGQGDVFIQSVATNIIPKPNFRGFVSVKEYGAKGDGVADDTSAIQNAISAATDKVLYFPSGDYLISADVIISGINGIVGERNSLIIRQTANNPVIKIENTNEFYVKNLCLKTDLATIRTISGNALELSNCTDFMVDNIFVDQWDGMGIKVVGCNNGIITRCRVSCTTADGIHITGGSNHISVRDCIISQTGDDGIASVTYQGNPRNKNITIINNHIFDTGNPNILANPEYGAKGISVVGTDKAIVKGNNIERVHHGGIFIGCDKSVSYTCQGVSDVVISDNIIDSPKNDFDHASIYVYSNVSGEIIQDVIISNNIVKNSKGRFLYLTVDTYEEQNIKNVFVNGNQFMGYLGEVNLPGVVGRRCKNVTVKDNYIFQSGLHAIYFADDLTSGINIMGNTIEDCNIKGGDIYAIEIQSPICIITDNRILDSANNHFNTRAIKAQKDGGIIRGNIADIVMSYDIGEATHKVFEQ